MFNPMTNEIHKRGQIRVRESNETLMAYTYGVQTSVVLQYSLRRGTEKTKSDGRVSDLGSPNLPLTGLLRFKK